MTAALVSRLSAWLLLFVADTKDASGFTEHPGEAWERKFLPPKGTDSWVDLQDRFKALEVTERKVGILAAQEYLKRIYTLLVDGE